MIDTHAHYDDAQFDQDLDEVFALAKTAGVKQIINAASDVSSLEKISGLLRQYDFLFAAAGLHPENAADLLPEDFVSDSGDDLSLRLLTCSAFVSHMDRVRAMAQGELPDAASAGHDGKMRKIVAIGETGLDYHYETPAPDAAISVKTLAEKWNHGNDPVNWPPRALQREVFRFQIAMAKELRLPLVVHSRDACEDTLLLLKEADIGENGCDMHCFGYSKESARDYLNLGCYLGIGGVSTFKNGRKCKEVIAFAPLDRLLLETDAPYLTPEPYRGKRNQSAYLTQVVSAIAEIKGLDKERVIEQTTQNARSLFHL